MIGHRLLDRRPSALLSLACLTCLAGCTTGGSGCPEADAEADADVGDNDGSEACALAAAGARWLAFSSDRTGSQEIHIARADGTCHRRITTTDGYDVAPCWEHDGRGLLFVRVDDDDRRLVRHDLVTGAEETLDTGDVQAASGASHAPDNERIAIAAAPPGTAQTNLYTVSLRDGSVTQLTEDDELYDTVPDWAADDSAIFFTSNQTGAWEVHSIAPDGSQRTVHTSDSLIDGGPVVSPDSRNVVYTSARSSPHGLIVHEIATGRETQLTREFDSAPAFEPGGARLAVSSFRTGGNWEIFVLDAITGEALHQVTDDPGGDRAPAWRPDVD